MSLKNLSDEARQIVNPRVNDGVVIDRPISTNVPPDIENVEVSLTGYSNNFGGQLVDRDYGVIDKEITEDGNLRIALRVSDGEQGADYIVEYSVNDGTGTTDFAQFFYQNGVFPDSEAAPEEEDLTFRMSAELERFSGTFADGQVVEEATNFADLNGDFIDVPNLEFNTTSSIYRKHSGEPIPNFGGTGLINFPSDFFSSRASTVFIVLQWDQDFDKNFIIAQLEQGDKSYLEIRNEQQDVQLDSDFANTSLYKGPQPSQNVMVVSCVIDPSKNVVRGSVNRRINKSPKNLTGESFASGFSQLSINPAGEASNPNLFDVLVYDDALTEGNVNRVAKQLSYFYGADMTSSGLQQNITSPTQEHTAGSGSPKIQNHMFFNEDILRYDLLTTGEPTESYDVSVDPAIQEWSYSKRTGAVAFNSHRKAAVGTGNNNVALLSSEGNEIWNFEGHTGTIVSVEIGKQYGVYSASNDGSVRKIGNRGNEVWKYDGFEDDQTNARSIALYDDLAVYVGASDGTVRRLVESDGSESWVYNWLEDSSDPVVNAVGVNKSQEIFAAGANGEFRALDRDGNRFINTIPFEDEITNVDGNFTGEAINDLAVVGDYVYVVSGPYVKKLNASNGDEIWSLGPIEIDSSPSDMEAVAVHPDFVFVSGIEQFGFDRISKVFKIENGEIVSEIEGFDNLIGDLSVQPGSYEPHWRS